MDSLKQNLKTEVPEKPIKLWPKERKMLRGISRGLSPVEAVKKAYNVTTKGSAAAIASQKMRSVRFRKVLEKAGLTDEKIDEKIVEGLDAERPVLTKLGLVQTKDYMTRLGYVRTALKLKGLDNEKDPGEKDGEPLVINAIQINGQGVTIEKKE
jgi:hypothetical protein